MYIMLIAWNRPYTHYDISRHYLIIKTMMLFQNYG